MFTRWRSRDTETAPVAMQLDNRQQRTALLGMLVIVSLAALVLILPLWRSVVLGGVAGSLLYPLRKWFVERWHLHAVLASLLVYVAFFCVITIPLVIVLTASGHQAGQLSKSIAVKSLLASPDTFGALSSIDSQVLQDAMDAFLRWLQEGVVTGFARIAESVASVIGAAFDFLIGFVLFSFFLVVFNHNYAAISARIRGVSPFSQQVTTLYLRRTRLVTRDMAYGMFGVAGLQTLIMWATFALVGVEHAAAYIVPLFITTLIPLFGMGLVTIPVGIVLIINGQWSAALIIWLVHLIVISNIDIVLRPLLVSPEIRISRALVATSLIAGLVLLGFSGLFIGPIIIMLLVLTLDIYQANAPMQPSGGE